MKFGPRILIGCLVFLFGLREASGEFIGPPEKLVKLESDADYIFKGTAVSTRTVHDGSFAERFGYAVYDTRFSVISMIKGKEAGEAITFRHYDADKSGGDFGQTPSHYHFEIGRSYIMFAKKSGSRTHVVQVMTYTSPIPDQGALLCADKKPVAGGSVKEVYWNDLAALLKSTNTEDVEYAIDQIDQMGVSREELNSTQDFDRKQSLVAISSLAESEEPKVAVRALKAIGCGNPFLNEDFAPSWVAAFGGGNFPGLGTMDLAMKNPGGELFWEKLVAIASNQKLSAPVREAAIRALGLVKEPAVEKAIQEWIKDPAVRAPATLLMADFPGSDANEVWEKAAGDSSDEVVRAAAAYAIGYARAEELAPVLGTLLKDKYPRVRRAAAISLLSFPASADAIEEIFRDNLTNQEFHPLFLNALARVKPAKYLDGLAESVIEGYQPNYIGPTNWWGGLVPAFDSWKILRKYLRALPVEVVKSGKMDRYLDALEKVGDYSSSEPCEIYAFYMVRGMKERAARYRADYTKRSASDLGELFNRADADAAQYDKE